MLSKAGKQNILLLLAAFLLDGVLRVLFYGVVFTDNISQLFTGSILLFWALSLQKRVTDRRLRNLLLTAVFFLLLYLFLQILRYQFVDQLPEAHRFLWYAFYLPMMGTAVTVWLSALAIYEHPGRRLPASGSLAIAAGSLCTIGILTNDLHFLAFSFPSGIMMDNGDEVRGPLFWIFFLCLGLLLCAALLLFIKKNRMPGMWASVLLLSLPLLFLASFLLLRILGCPPRIRGIKVWQNGEVYCFGLLLFLEICIQTGMIPANTDYDYLFLLSGLPAVILDYREQPRYTPAGVSWPFRDSEDLQVHRRAIGGGRVEWAVDISRIRELNLDLESVARQIEARNAYLEAEAAVAAEKAELETRNRIYDEITRVVRPQLDRITSLMDNSEETFDRRLARIAVLCTYIKRRGNMELLTAGGQLPGEELFLALSESLDSLKLLGIETAIVPGWSGVCPADSVIRAYEAAQQVIEAGLPVLTDLVISLRESGEMRTMRLLLRPAHFPMPDLRDYPELSLEETAEEDRILVFRFRKEVSHD